VAAKTVKETVSEVADKVNKGLGKGLASAIDKGERATRATQETLGTAKSKDPGSDATKQEMNKASEKVDQAASSAKKVKEDVQGGINQ